MAKKDKMISAVLGVGAVFLAGYAGYRYCNPEASGVERQNVEESLAQAYIEALLQDEMQMTTQIDTEADGENFERDSTVDLSEEASESVFEDELELEETEWEETTQWSDSNYYIRDGITYTPEYAMGELLGVLEIDHAGIRRGVYGGSWEAIEHDLDIWMTTVARPDYEIGKTHFAIYGHNHTVQDLSFNRLKDVVLGDVFTYTTDQGVFIYDVTRFLADWRELVTRDYVDNFSISADKCYIISCGRNEYRYKDIVVEGTLRCVIDLNEYARQPYYYKYEYKYEENEVDESSTISLYSPDEETEAFSKKTEKSSKMAEASLCEEKEESVSAEQKRTMIEVFCTENGKISARCIDNDGTSIPCEMALFDSDGLMVTRWEQPEESMPDVELIDDFDYVIGIINLKTADATMPEDYIFQYHSGSIDRQELYQADDFDRNGAPRWAGPLFYGMAGLFLLLLAFLLFLKK